MISVVFFIEIQSFNALSSHGSHVSATFFRITQQFLNATVLPPINDSRNRNLE